MYLSIVFVINGADKWLDIRNIIVAYRIYYSSDSYNKCYLRVRSVCCCLKVLNLSGNRLYSLPLPVEKSPKLRAACSSSFVALVSKLQMMKSPRMHEFIAYYSGY